MKIKTILGLIATSAEGIACARCIARIISREIIPTVPLLILNCFGIIFWTSLFWITLYYCVIKKYRYWEHYDEYLDEDF